MTDVKKLHVMLPVSVFFRLEGTITLKTQQEPLQGYLPR